jgi:hypothetical protein
VTQVCVENVQLWEGVKLPKLSYEPDGMCRCELD